MKNTVVILTRDQEYFEAKLRGLNLPDLDILAPQDTSNAQDAVSKANIMFANPLIARRYINESRNIVWMQSTFTGVDAIIEDGLRRGGDPCPNEFETSYAPDRPEIVYCEQCYQSEII